MHFIKLLLFTMFIFSVPVIALHLLRTLIQVRHSITRVRNLLWTLVIIIDVHLMLHGD